jgi:hypothetical protein
VFKLNFDVLDLSRLELLPEIQQAGALVTIQRTMPLSFRPVTGAPCYGLGISELDTWLQARVNSKPPLVP